jgi:hypothetical protein
MPTPRPAEEVYQKGISKKAQRRQAKRAEQRRLQELRQQRLKQEEDVEFLKIAKSVERLKQAEDTIVKMDQECLTEELDAKLRKLEWERRQQARGMEAGRGPTEAQLLERHIQVGAQRGGHMRREIVTFVESIAGNIIVPEPEAFASNLVTKLLAGAARHLIEGCDTQAAEEVYGSFAQAFCSHEWKEPLLARINRRAVLTAAATEESQSPHLGRADHAEGRRTRRGAREHSQVLRLQRRSAAGAVY